MKNLWVLLLFPSIIRISNNFDYGKKTMSKEKIISYTRN